MGCEMETQKDTDNEIKESPPAVTEPEREQEQTPSESNELLQLEVYAYRRHFDALNAELAEIRSKHGANISPEDRVNALAGEVAEIKKDFSELKEIITQAVKNNASQSAQNTAHHQWQPQAYFPQANFLQSPGLPYLSTPSYMPIMPVKQQ